MKKLGLYVPYRLWVKVTPCAASGPSLVTTALSSNGTPEDALAGALCVALSEAASTVTARVVALFARFTSAWSAPAVNVIAPVPGASACRRMSASTWPFAGIDPKLQVVAVHVGPREP